MLSGSLPKSSISFSSSIQGCSMAMFYQKNGELKRNRHSPLIVSAEVRHLTGSLTRTEGLRFSVVAARFNQVVTKLLLEGALETFKKYSVRDEDVDVVWVPGSCEIPIVAEKLGRGDTSHYDAVPNSASSGVLSASLNSGTPCIFGVLTCDNMDQAINRAGGKSGNKGADAALIV